MAFLYVTEFAELAIGPGGRVGQIPQRPPLAEQAVAVAAGHAESNAFNAATRIVRLHSDVICSMVIGTNPVATAANARMAANQTEFYGVPVGGAYKVSVITNS
jgi:hypothetical protein